MLRLLSLLLCVTLTRPGLALASDTDEGVAPWQWLVGEFTNYQHTLREPEQGLTPTVYKVQVVDQNDNGSVTLLSQQFYLFNQQQPLRQRIYQFSERRRGWRQHVYEVAADARGAELENSENWQRLTGCQLDWRLEGTRFEGATDASRCYFVLQDKDVRVGIASRTYLYPDRVEVSDTFRAEPEVLAELESHQVQTNYARMTYYDAKVSYRPNRGQDWLDVVLSDDLHDQGGRMGLIESSSELELRFQFELVRSDDELTFRVFDITRQQHVHEARYEDGVDSIEYESDMLQVRLKPRP